MGILSPQRNHPVDEKSQFVDESIHFTNTRVLIDPRVIAEVERKKPIGVNRTSWVNLLLQRAIASEPEPLPRD
jgi:hypothetical protein|tara:strand:- start:83 stop:301 length:219 start_codon:yes stop_codon:yes gene_type:complete